MAAHTVKSLCGFFLCMERLLNGSIEVRKVSEVGNEAKLCFKELGPFLGDEEMFNGQEVESKCAIFTSISFHPSFAVSVPAE